MSRPTRLWVFVTLILGGFTLAATAQQTRNIGNLLGRTDANHALVITMAEAAEPYSAPRAIGNLLGKTDRNHALVVTCPDGSCGGGAGPRVLASSVTAAQTGANTDETTLFSTVVPANTLNADAQALRLTASGTCGIVNQGVLMWRVRLGATVLFEAPIVDALGCGTWNLDVTIYRTAADAQYATGVLRAWYIGGEWFDELGNVRTGAIDLTAAQTLALTGQSSTATAGDITFRAGTVEILR